MLEVVALSALTTFLTGMWNGASGEIGKQLSVSTGVLVRRTLGRDAPVPTGPEGWEDLARQMHERLGRDPQLAGEWLRLVQSLPEPTGAGTCAGGLPPAPRDFTNRQKIVKRLKREATRRPAGRPRVALLHGPPGIGTTSVALHLGALYRSRFPDGQFYVDLRDAAGENGLDPAAVLLRLLLNMGVERDRMPPTAAGREQLYRRLTAHRKALVVVDHASSYAQVRRLVPASPDVFLLVVVSGRPFALDAERVAVAGLSDRYAVRMMRKVAGRERVARARREMPALLEGCGGNAFALKTAALALRDREDVRVPDQGLTGDPVRDTIRGVCDRLRPETARMCRLVALGGWPAIDAHLAAAAADVTAEEADGMLAEAAEARLLELVPGDRYRFRPEVRRYLADTAGPELGTAACSAAVDRVLDALLRRALHAAHSALPQSWRTEPAPEEGPAYGGEAAGVAALGAEVGNLVRAVSVAEEYRHVDTALRLARALWPLQLKAGYWDEVLPALRVAVRCADERERESREPEARMAEARMAGALHFQLAHCLGELKQFEDAGREARAAVECERAAGHLRGEASAVELQGLLGLQDWKYEPAYECFVESEGIYRRIGAGEEGAGDVPRALALSGRHQGRALRGRGRLDESRRLLEVAVDYFKVQGEAYNQARSLTDLAETLHDAGEDAEAISRIAEAERLLTPEATPHLSYLANLRLRCEGAG
ncbi:ATP-binding protein [Streptomyces sp. NPDC046821]|uniref:ATP-binding protein n=1 Tax=Streptomyces sp. NPDC046821 TaxID=3154702 RepID=UPI0033DE4B90